MGYCVFLNENEFSFDKSKGDKVLECIKKGILDKTITKDRWISFSDILKFNTVEELFDEIRFPLYVDGNKYKIDYFSAEKWGGYEEQMFKAMSKYVDNGYLEFLGADGEMWRYVFEDGKFRESFPTIIWS